jgi:hypothetical protein
MLIKERPTSAKECALSGLSTAFYFDQIIYCDNWKRGYRETIDIVFDTFQITEKMSLGPLRMPAAQKAVIENRFLRC